MHNEQIVRNTAVASNQFNNSGGPRSRKNSQKVYSDFLSDSQVGTTQGVYYLDIPSHVNDIECWLENLAKQLGYSNLAKAIELMELPNEKHLVFSDTTLMKTSLTPFETLRSALILAKCNSLFYNPSLPPILTKSRLNRTLRLVTCNQHSFYGLDQ
ncbi:MAG: hypothetical protein ACR2IL_00035 [Chitinophagaceae bacterium]